MLPRDVDTQRPEVLARPENPRPSALFSLRRPMLVLALAFAACGLALLAFAAYSVLAPNSPDSSRDSVAADAMHKSGAALLAGVGRIVQPAIERTERLARNPDLIAAIRAGDRAAQTRLCNLGVMDATEIDALALFDKDGRIAAINSVYADGSPIAKERVDRILAMSFNERDIIQRCVRNNSGGNILEFQTTCDITPAFFDSTGLSVAISIPVFDPASHERIGVASSRLRFERLLSLLGADHAAAPNMAAYFVTDKGGYFSEVINSHHDPEPVPAAELAGLVAPLIKGQAYNVIVKREHEYVNLLRLEDFTTLDGGGIQVMLLADADWVEREVGLRRRLSAGAPLAIGLLLIALAGMVRLTDVAVAARRACEAASREADAANRTKSEFLANMSHEIRTPLTTILGYADLLRELGDINRAPERRVQVIDTIRVASNHLLTVINDILDLSKIEAGKMEVEKVDADLPALLRELESMVGPRARAKGLAFSVELVTPVPSRILTDPTRLRQILLNLAGNAVKFTDEGAVAVRVRADELLDAHSLTIDVIDTGCGISPAQAERLFAPFVQSDSSVTRIHGGTGLGLTICRRLARMMGGEVSIVASEPEKGSTFRVSIGYAPVAGAPIIRNLHAVSDPAPVQAPSSSLALRGRLLLAEDGPENQRLICHHLTKAGAVVDVADNGRIALELFESAPSRGVQYDLIITDMQMPEIDGYTLARTLRSRGVSLPILALTAHAMAEDRQKCLDAGCDDYASKPIDKAALIRTCAAWLSRTANVSSRRAA